ncbi:MAG: hypothetical protein O8C64_07580 [Candidatus Methanoperedens sp.]|nr:hypothetical protein [Candidatus Methanoperedens sp.]
MKFKYYTWDFCSQINMGFSSCFKKATEPQVPEGTVVFALCLLKASAAPDEGSKEKKI